MVKLDLKVFPRTRKDKCCQSHGSCWTIFISFTLWSGISPYSFWAEGSIFSIIFLIAPWGAVTPFLFAPTVSTRVAKCLSMPINPNTVPSCCWSLCCFIAVLILLAFHGNCTRYKQEAMQDRKHGQSWKFMRCFMTMWVPHQSVWRKWRLSKEII